jgi:hypothetical protein
MISDKTLTNTRDTLSEMYFKQGGSLFFNTILNSNLDTDMVNWKTSVNVPVDYKEFSISIYNTRTDTDINKLVLFINPKDLVIGQQQIVSNSYTRRGWVNVAWGNQQATLSASGVSSGFYFYAEGKGGLTNFYRRRTPSFINIMDLMALFKNNGWYFLNGMTNPSLFKDGWSRVISVMDSIKIEYDGSTYIGSFSTFNLNDIANSPYKMEYSFEFIVSSFGVDLQGIEGHISRDDNFKDNEVHVALQGYNIGFKSVIGLDADELNRYFPIDSYEDLVVYDYTVPEEVDEVAFFSKVEEKNTVVKVPPGVFRITRGWRDGEKHSGKCDFRTHTGTVYSATEGTVRTVKKSPPSVYGGSNFVIVESTWDGKRIYVRYFHLSPDSITLSVNDSVGIGTIIGHEGTDGGKYPQHCDFGVRIISGMNTNYLDCLVMEASPILDNMWKILHPLAESDSTYELDFKKLIAKHPNEHVISI